MLELLSYLLAVAAGAVLAAVVLRARPRRGAAGGLSESDRKIAEEELLAATARLKRATRGANDGLWELDVARREMWVSENFAEMFGYEQQEFLGARQKFFDILHAEDAVRLREAIERTIRDGGLVDVEVRAKTRAGEARWYRVRGALERK